MLKVIHESERIKEHREEITSLSTEQLEIRKKEETDFRKTLYKYADEIIESIYNNLQSIHRKEVVLLQQKIKINNKRSKLLSLIGRPVYNRRVNIVLPNRKFEI